MEQNKKVNRPSGLVYNKSKKKQESLKAKLKRLINVNYSFTNDELAGKLGITTRHFYRLGFGVISKEYRDKCVRESLFGKQISVKVRGM